MTVDEWFNQKYWPSYPADLCGSTAKKGSKAEALNIIKTKIKPDKSLMETMSKNLSAQVIQARKDNDPARFPFLTTYLNKKRYLDVVEQENTEKPAIEQRNCTIEGCNSAVHGPDYPYCTSHLPAPDGPVIQRMRELYKENGLIRKEGESKSEHTNRLRLLAKSQIKGLIRMPENLK